MSDGKIQGSSKQWLWRKPISLLNRSSQSTTSHTDSGGYTNRSIGLVPSLPDCSSASVKPPRIFVYDLGATCSPAYAHQPPFVHEFQLSNSWFRQDGANQFHHPTGVDSMPLEEIREEEPPRERARPVETTDAPSHQDKASPSVRFPKPRQPVELVDPGNTVPSVSGPEPPQNITIDPATTADSRTSRRNGIVGTSTSEFSLNMDSLAPPVPNDHFSSPIEKKGATFPNLTEATSGQSGGVHSLRHPDTVEWEEAAATWRENTNSYDVNKPTCSLNLVCYRSGATGCDLQQLHCILYSKFPSKESFLEMTTANPNLIATDGRFFREMRQVYRKKMCGFFRRHFSLKTLNAFRVLAYAPSKRPTVVPFDDFVLQEMMYAYQNPGRLGSGDDWIQWVFRLRRKDTRHALEFAEGWNTTRIAVAGAIPWLSSCLVGISWTAAGGDPQTAFTVASFILTSSSIVLALLAIISSIESSGRTVL